MRDILLIHFSSNQLTEHECYIWLWYTHCSNIYIIKYVIYTIFFCPFSFQFRRIWIQLCDFGFSISKSSFIEHTKYTHILRGWTHKNKIEIVRYGWTFLIGFFLLLSFNVVVVVIIIYSIYDYVEFPILFILFFGIGVSIDVCSVFISVFHRWMVVEIWFSFSLALVPVFYSDDDDVCLFKRLLYSVYLEVFAIPMPNIAICVVCLCLWNLFVYLYATVVPVSYLSVIFVRLPLPIHGKPNKCHKREKMLLFMFHVFFLHFSRFTLFFPFSFLFRFHLWKFRQRYSLQMLECFDWLRYLNICLL